MQLDVQELHGDQGTQNGQGHDAADDDASSPTQEEYDHCHDDHDGLSHHLIHLAHLAVHDISLKGDVVQREAGG